MHLKFGTRNTLFTLIGLLIFARSAFGADIVLDPAGPISTPLAARDAARKADKPVRIVVGDGSYAIAEAIALTAEDSGTTWVAAEGAIPVFSGGRRISGWQKAGGESGLWKASVVDKDWNFVQLWIDGRRATRARTPNRGFFHLTEKLAEGVFPDLTENVTYHGFSVAPEHFEIIKAIPEVERDGVLLTVAHAWSVGQCRIADLDDATKSVRIKAGSRYPFVEKEPDQRYWLENFRNALDARGEWFLDRAKSELWYSPLEGEDMSKAEIFAPVAEKFLTIKGAKDVVFDGIAFRHGQYRYPEEGLHDGQAATLVDGAIEIEDSAGIRFQNCEVAHVGRHAIYFKNGCSDSAVVHCRLHDLGGGGVRIGETARPSAERVNHHIVVDDCIIQHGGRLHPSACGVTLTHTQHCAVRQCDIGDFYYSGVSAGWNWGYGETASRETLVESNHIHHLGWGYLSDMGGYYGLGTSPGTVIRGNHIHHIVSHRYGGWGLYNDEGSADTRMENNLVHDTWNAGFHQHYGYYNAVRNNIFAFGKSAQVQLTRHEPRLSFVYERNIVVWDPAVPLLDGGEWNWQLNDAPGNGDPRDTAVFRNNLYWPTDGKVPALLTATHYSWDEWRKMGRDKGSEFADPLFEDVGARDFRLKENSPAERIGFREWDLSLAGVRKDDPKWRELAAEGQVYPNWDADARPWPAPEYEIAMQTFETVPPGVIGIRNAKYQRHHEQEDRGEGFAVSDEAASPIPVEGSGGGVSKRSLKAQDMPGLAQTFYPILDIYPIWEAGTFRVAFDIMAQPGADWFFEMRGKDGAFAAGPYVRWQNGKLVANNASSLALADLKAGEWCRVVITAETGAGKYDVQVTLQDGEKKEFKDVPCKAEWISGSYLLFSAIGNSETAFFIDNLSLIKQN